MERKFLLAVTGVMVVLAGLGTPAWPASVVLEWDPNTESDLAGYRLFQSSQSLLGLTPAQAMQDAAIRKTVIADASATSTTVTGLTPQTLYYFRLTAFDAADNQSDFNVDQSGAPAQVVVFLGEDNEARAPEKFLSPGLADGINDRAVFGDEAEEVTIVDVNGRKIYHATRAEAGGTSLSWDCRDAAGRRVNSGVYIAKIRMRDGGIRYQTFAVVK